MATTNFCLWVYNTIGREKRKHFVQEALYYTNAFKERDTVYSRYRNYVLFMSQIQLVTPFLNEYNRDGFIRLFTGEQIKIGDEFDSK